MTRTRFPLAIAALLAVAMVFSALAATPSFAAGTNVKIRNAKIRPKELSGAGGQAGIQVKIKAGKLVTIQSVEAITRGPNGAGPVAQLQEGKLGKKKKPGAPWSGNVLVEPNPTDSKVNYKVEVNVNFIITGKGGQKKSGSASLILNQVSPASSKSKVVGTIKVRKGTGGNDDLPPPPPI